MKIYKCDRCGKGNVRGFIQLSKDLKEYRDIDLFATNALVVSNAG